MKIDYEDVRLHEQLATDFIRRKRKMLFDDTREFIDATLGRVIKHIGWKLGLVDLIWNYNSVRVIRTDAKTGGRFIFQNGSQWNEPANVDWAIDAIESDKDNSRPRGAIALYKGFFAPKLKHHIFKSNQTKMLQMTAAWDRESAMEVKLGQDKSEWNTGVVSAHTHSLNDPSNGY